MLTFYFAQVHIRLSGTEHIAVNFNRNDMAQLIIWSEKKEVERNATCADKFE